MREVARLGPDGAGMAGDIDEYAKVANTDAGVGSRVGTGNDEPGPAAVAVVMTCLSCSAAEGESED